MNILSRIQKQLDELSYIYTRDNNLMLKESVEYIANKAYEFNKEVNVQGLLAIEDQLDGLLFYEVRD